MRIGRASAVLILHFGRNIMESVKSGILKIFSSGKIFALFLFLATAVLSGLLYLSTKDSRSGQTPPSFVL